VFKKVSFSPGVLNKTICIGVETSQEVQTKLLGFLDKNSNVFAWSTLDLVGVSRDVIEHQLQVSPNAKLKKQKLFKMAEEKVEAAKVEVQRLLDASIIREVKYPEWMANVVMVRKKMESGECVLTLQTEINVAPKTTFPSQESIKL
jgi:hypothetical protein